MSAQVKEFKRQPDSFALDYVKGLQERIEKGETTGIVAIEQCPDGYNMYTCGGIENRWKTIGFLTRMIYKLNETA
jgi:hypothetical protein